MEKWGFGMRTYRGGLVLSFLKGMGCIRTKWYSTIPPSPNATHSFKDTKKPIHPDTFSRAHRPPKR